jgi:small subunit ribosomal protein S8
MSSVNDPIGDLLTRMRNAQAARRKTCSAPLSRIKKELCDLMVKEGWLEKVEVKGEAPKQELEVTFVIGKTLTLKRMSTPGRRLYASVKELDPVLRGYGQAILTTSEGLMTDGQAREKKMGGEVLCTIA